MTRSSPSPISYPSGSNRFLSVRSPAGLLVTGAATLMVVLLVSSLFAASGPLPGTPGENTDPLLTTADPLGSSTSSRSATGPVADLQSLLQPGASTAIPDPESLDMDALQSMNLALAGSIAALFERDDLTREEKALRLVELVSRTHVAMLGLEWEQNQDGPQHATPSEAIRTLSERHNGHIGPEQEAALAELDALPLVVRENLTAVVDAFLAMETATHRAFENVDPSMMEEHLEGILSPDGLDAGAMDDVATPGEIFTEMGMDLSGIFPARLDLVEAGIDLKAALNETGVELPSLMVPMSQQQNNGNLPEQEIHEAGIGILCMNSADETNTYTEDCILLLDDRDGDTRFYNNAGGSDGSGTAALVDLSDRGNKIFGDPDNPRGNGANGGGSLGVGFLLIGCPRLQFWSR